MPRVFVTTKGQKGVSFGCLGTLLIGFVYVIGFFIIVGAIVAAVVAAIFIALVALGVDRVLLALSPKRRARRLTQPPFRPVSSVIDSTATLVSKKRP